MESGVVDATRRCVNPAIGNARDDDVRGGVHVDGEVDGDQGIELRGLNVVAWEAVEDEGGVGRGGVGVFAVGVGGWQGDV